MCAHLQSLQEAKGSQSSSSRNQAESGIVQHFTIVIPAQKHTNKWYKCLSWILSVFSTSVSLPPNLPVSHRHIHEEQKQTACTQLGAWEDSHVFPDVKETVISLPLRSELRAATLTQMASSPLMRARKKYSVKEVWRLKEQAVIYQAENHSSFTGEHVKVKVVRRWLPCAAMWWSCWLQSSCAICLLSSLVDADFVSKGRTHTHTHTPTERNEA